MNGSCRACVIQLMLRVWITFLINSERTLFVNICVFCVARDNLKFERLPTLSRAPCSKEQEWVRIIPIQAEEMLRWIVSNYLQHIFVLRSNRIKVAIVFVCALMIWNMLFISLLCICVHSHDPNDRSHIPSILNIVKWSIALGIPESYLHVKLVEV